MEKPSKADLIDMLEAAADHMVREGCLNTTQGNWTFDFDEISAYLSAADIGVYQDTICALLAGREEVATVNMVDGRFAVYYNLAYCPNYEAMPDVGEIEPNSDSKPEKPSIMAQLALHKQAALQGAKPPETAPFGNDEREI